MIEVVVIDDEPVILRNIIRLIEETDKDFKVIGKAINGEEGLKKIQTLKPDLAFVDISMPILNGIDMIEYLRKINNNVPIVILSGYTEFEDAKKAIQLGVIDYLVKPLNPLMLSNFLDSVKEKIKGAYVDKYYDILRNVLIYPYSKVDNIQNADKELFYITKICIGPFNFYRNNNFESSHAVIGKGLLEKIIEEATSISEYWFVEGRYLNEFVLVYRNTKDDCNKMMERVFARIKAELKGKSYVTLVYSDTASTVKRLREKLTDLDSILYHGSIFEESIMLNSHTIIPEKMRLHFIEQELRLLKNVADFDKQVDFKEIVKKIIEKCKCEKVTQAQIIQVVREIIDTINVEKVINDPDIVINNSIVNAVNYLQLEEQLIQLIDDYFKTSIIQEDTYSNSEGTVLKIKAYIDKHYAEKILIQDIADKFGFNYSYLCIIFKKYLDFSPNEYLIMTRIRAAKELLKQTQKLSIKAVAELVGYSDPYYFSRLFKLNTGQSPSEYKRRL